MRNTPSKHCNCQQKENCPMNGACLSLVYYATINCNDKNYKPKLYKGSCEASFKKRYQAINRILELKNEVTEPTDILDIKRNI